MKKKILLCSVIPLVAAATLLFLFFANAVLTPEYTDPGSVREGALISEYYVEKTPHQVIFLGDCEVYESFTPPTLWEEYGITSYVRGSAQQLVWQSYYLLEEMLKAETPEIVVFNVFALKYGEPQKEEYNRLTLDGMRFSPSKWKAVQASMTEGESALSYLFPLLRYHARWEELTIRDFDLSPAPIISHNGYLMQTEVLAKEGEEIPGEELADYTLPARSMEYLEKMRLLCEEKGVTLLLVKAPTNNWKYYWYDEWDAQVSDYAKEHSLDYFNFIPKASEIGLDWSTDTYDRGVHLNVWGAEKLTSYFGAVLRESYGLQDLRSDPSLSAVWQEKVSSYYAERTARADQ